MGGVPGPIIYGIKNRLSARAENLRKPMSVANASVDYKALDVQSFLLADSKGSIVELAATLGSPQRFADWIERLLRAVASALASGRLTDVVSALFEPAVYRDSVERGVSQLERGLSMRAHCNNEKYILVGHSQGANVVHVFLARNKTFSNKLVQAYLLADPAGSDMAVDEAGRHVATGPVGLLSDESGEKGLAPPFPGTIEPKVISYCALKDLVCDWRNPGTNNMTSEGAVAWAWEVLLANLADIVPTLISGEPRYGGSIAHTVAYQGKARRYVIRDFLKWLDSYLLRVAQDQKLDWKPAVFGVAAKVVGDLAIATGERSGVYLNGVRISSGLRGNISTRVVAQASYKAECAIKRWGIRSCGS